jgi:hypothetical protein
MNITNIHDVIADEVQEGGDLANTQAAPIFEQELTMMYSETLKLHCSYDGGEEDTTGVNEVTKDDESWFSRRKRRKHQDNWRTPIEIPTFQWGKNTYQPKNKTFFCRDKSSWRENKREKNELKYCPGNSCCVWLPLEQFAKNLNVADGMDRYCIKCNRLKRMELNAKRKQRKNNYIIDSLEQFRSEVYMSKKTNLVKTNTIKKINEVITQTEKKTRKNIPFTANTIFASLFDGHLFKCKNTHEFLTPACFLRHHEVSFTFKAEMCNVHVTNVHI